MKKEYIKPIVEAINVKCEEMIALSLQDGSEINETNKSEFEMYSRENQGTWSYEW